MTCNKNFVEFNAVLYSRESAGKSIFNCWLAVFGTCLAHWGLFMLYQTLLWLLLYGSPILEAEPTEDPTLLSRVSLTFPLSAASPLRLRSPWPLVTASSTVARPGEESSRAESS